MRILPSLTAATTRSCIAVLAAFIMLTSSLSTNARAEDIPHENYDLVQSNLDVVISLLNMSIGYSEFALIRMYNESMTQVQENLTIVSRLIMPASRILDEIRNVAGSYENLSMLLPPFTSLSSQMDSFASMEVTLLGARDEVVSASRLANLTGQEMLNALDAIRRVNTLIHLMNNTIDDMLVSANGIIDLVVQDVQPFTDNQLIPLIEQLRDLLYTIEVLIDYLTREQVPWSQTEPFSILWLSAGDYYLGDDVTGGGYLYFEGSFASNHLVTILMDGQNLTNATTSSQGQFYFSYPIPLNASWLGSHQLQATSLTPVGAIDSNTVTIRILLIPTSISLLLNSTLLTFEDELLANVHLKDFRGNSLAQAQCHFVLDENNQSFQTDADGNYDTFWLASNLGFGSHAIQAFYDAELPYASSASEKYTIVINIPTSVDLRLFATRYHINDYIVGNGTLLANGTTPMPGEAITLSIDGTVVANLTTAQDGTFTFTVSSEGMKAGGHRILAEYLHHASVWRYSNDELSFTLHGLKVGKYPFWPVIPKWSLGSGDEIPYLFIGQYAYIFWLLILLAAAVAIRTLQMREKRTHTRRSEVEAIESLDKVAQALPGVEAAMAALAEDMLRVAEGPANPNERVIWYYQRLLTFLTAKDNIAIKGSMTHWEVAKVLKTLGFPVRPVERATSLFEGALYSGKQLTDEDAVMMSTALTDLVRAKGPEASHAA